MKKKFVSNINIGLLELHKIPHNELNVFRVDYLATVKIINKVAY